MATGAFTVIDIGTTLNQRFLLEKELGRGGMGAVYSATDQKLQRRVAIKVLKESSGPEVQKKLHLEAQIAARLMHENVVTLYDIGEAGDTCFLIMEQVDGTSYSKRWRHLTMEERLRVLAQVAEALDYAHHQGVIHRDIKPGNVLLTSADVPKLSDFGLSILVEQGDQSGAIRGTPLYMSPEQTKGVPLDYRSDLYSLGVMIYESSAGATPFAGNSMAVMTQHVSTAPSPPRSKNPWISEDLETLILALLSKRPDERPRSGTAVAEALRQEVERLAADRRQGGNAGEMTTRASAANAAPSGAPASARNGTPGTERAAVPGASPSRAAVPSDPGAAGYAATEGTGELRGGVPGAAASMTRAGPAPASIAPGSSARNARPASLSAATGGLTVIVRSPLVRQMLATVLADPILLSAEERYLTGHYLAFLLSGSRRRGLLLRRPMEPRNADRARLMLGITYALLAGSTDEAIRDAAALLDQRIDVRPALSPVVVAKYLEARSSPGQRRVFRQTRKAIARASKYAQRRLLDVKGVLNPGLMPQRLEDLHHIAPPRTEVDDVLVERWNRVAEVWRIEPEFRHAVLRYATTNAYEDPASVSLWPEVVYPLIERARLHRRLRTRLEAVWDYLCAQVLHVPDAGVQLDRAMHRSVPAPLAAQLDDSLELLVESPHLDEEEADPMAAQLDEADRLAASISVGGDRASLEAIAEPGSDSRERAAVRLVDLDPLRFSQTDLHELWKEAITALQQVQARPGSRPPTHRHVPVGPYRLTVIPSVRGRTAGQVAIQGMSHKQIELSTPTVRTKGSSSKALVAIWVYEDSSLVVAHLDFMGSEHYILWHAPLGHQLNFTDAGELNHELFSLGMEIPDQLDRVLTRSFRPRNPV